MADRATYFAYNDDGQLALITRPGDGSETIGFTYDHDHPDQLRVKTLPTGQGALHYDYYPPDASTGAGQVQTIVAPDDGVLRYTYDCSGLLFQEAWDGSQSGTFSGSVERIHDRHGRIAVETVNFNHAVEREYDHDGFLIQAGAMTFDPNDQTGLLDGTTLGEVTDAVSRNQFGEVTEYSASYDGAPVLGVDYHDRDNRGRITHRTETLDLGTPTTEESYYRYDRAGRLTHVCSDEACSSGNVRAHYVYDANSNRAAGSYYLRNGVPETLATVVYDSQDRLLQYNDTRYEYTANGELTLKSEYSGATLTRETSYDYDALGNLRQAVITDATTTPDTVTTIEYVIDGQNRRIGKKVNGVLVQGFLYENQLRIAAELDGDGNVRSRFVYGDKVNVPEYMIRNGQTYRLITDHLGSPRLAVNTATGAVVQQIDYDEFGVVTTDTNPGFQSFGFAGGIFDRDTKLTRFGERDYDAMAGRWTAKDPIGFEGGDLLLYGYGVQDPVNNTDPSGEKLAEYVAVLASMGATYAVFSWAAGDCGGSLLGNTGAAVVPGLVVYGTGPVGLGLVTSMWWGHALGAIGGAAQLVGDATTAGIKGTAGDCGK